MSALPASIWAQSEGCGLWPLSYYCNFPSGILPSQHGQWLAEVESCSHASDSSPMTT